MPLPTVELSFLAQLAAVGAGATPRSARAVASRAPHEGLGGAPGTVTGGAGEPRAATRPDDDRRAEDDRAPLDPLDPEARRLAQLAPPPGSAPPVRSATAAGEPDVAPRARVSIEELLPQLVRRIAWAGDGRRGSVQLELGAGRHAGAVVTITADAGRVRIVVDGADELRARVGAQLAARGLVVDSVE